MEALAAIPRRWAPALFAFVILRLGVGDIRAHEDEASTAPVIRSVGDIRFVPRGDDPRPLVFSEATLRKRLREAIGTPCEPERLAEQIAAPYRALGYVPLVRASCEEGTLEIVVRESSHRIALVTPDPAALSGIGMAPGAFQSDERQLYPVPASAPRAVILGLLQTRPGDLYNVERYRSDRDAVERLGYLLLFIPGPPGADDAYPEGALLIQSLQPMAEDPKARRRRLNYLGGTASYEPRTGGSAGLVYQRRDIWQALDRLTISPSFATEVGGEITYAAPLLAAREEPRRLYDINVGAYSRFRNDRLLEGQEVDERRSGISLTLGARPLGLAAPNDLRLEAGVRREAVHFGSPPPGEEDADLTLLRLGATHVWRHTYLRPSLTIRSIPLVEVSLDVGDGVPFVRPSFAAWLHGRMRSGFEVDVHLVGGGLDRPVPDFELWSLGGVSSVRGFQVDTRLGRGMAALQSEVWIPFARPIEARPPEPGESADASAIPVEPSIARRLKAALFFDGGTIWQSTGGGRDELYGAGIGLRFVVPHEPLVIRIDYGWGLGGAGDDSYPYFSIGYSR
jgi:hypothetical protein